jgi:transposase
MDYRIAGIDVHKRMLAVAVSDVSVEGEYQFQRLQFGTTPSQLQLLARWLVEQQVREVVMESTAQYWKPVWHILERDWKPARPGATEDSLDRRVLHLAQAQSNRAPQGRKNDFADAERLVKRLVAQELTLSFVPDQPQRLWRTLTHARQQLVQDRVRLHNHLEALLEEAHLKLSSVVSDLLGVSGRRMLQALAEGETDAVRLAQLADRRLRARAEQLQDVFSAAQQLHPMYRRLLQRALEHLQCLEQHLQQLDQDIAALLAPHHATIQRLAEVPGLGVEAAHQIIAEIGPRAAVFPSAKDLCSWVGVCPGEDETGGVCFSSASPKGNRTLRRVLNQAAHAAVKVKGSIFDVVFARLKPRLRYQEAIWAIAHRLCRLIWKLLHQEVSYIEMGPHVSAQSRQTRTARMIRKLQRLGYRVELSPTIGALA